MARENGNEPLEFAAIRKRISQVNQRIDELDAMLRSDFMLMQAITIERLSLR